MKRKELKQEEMEQLVVFRLGKEEFGVQILQVQEIILLSPITRVPKTPAFVEGVINLRGEIIPVVDLRKRFGLEVGELGEDARIVVVEVEGNLVGMIVDEVTQPLSIPASQIQPPPPLAGGVEAEYLRGIGKLEDRLIVILNLERALSPEEVKALAEMEV
ncbi:MAG TPA: chemotaxis protein CheW [Bacillota bacterium]|nr:chemotaxis protein CheW [Bacillota bacterium]HQD40231.1 chemotaxis protein CheW [Bacillota bacterium]